MLGGMNGYSFFSAPGALVLFLIHLAVIARVILRPHREPASRIAWIVMIIALPVVGMISYLLLGETNIGRHRMRRIRQVLASMPDVVDTRRTLLGMVESGLIGGGSPLAFTPRGRVRARDLVRRRRLAEVLFSSTLRVPEARMEYTACRMEHIIDPEVTDSICAFLGHPRHCPHGKPIPFGDCCELPIVS